mmetsp:Transcript_22267/g.35779  ORF Transcript_22267/g.35779 Transcript_22267/m.35779 type:complete len:81 (-) Transcript_22267:314-556(-)
MRCESSSQKKLLCGSPQVFGMGAREAIISRPASVQEIERDIAYIGQHAGRALFVCAAPQKAFQIIPVQGWSRCNLLPDAG